MKSLVPLPYKIKDFEVTVRVRNNHLKERRDALGLNQRQIADKCGINQTTYGLLETLNEYPFTKKGEWRPCVLKVLKFLRVLPEDLFPEAILQVKQAKTIHKLSMQEIEQLLPERQYKQLAGGPDPQAELIHDDLKNTLCLALDLALSEEEKKVIVARFGLDGNEELTEEDLAYKFQLPLKQVWKIEDGALEKLRPLHISKRLWDFL